MVISELRFVYTLKFGMRSGVILSIPIIDYQFKSTFFWQFLSMRTTEKTKQRPEMLEGVAFYVNTKMAPGFL